jgi:hypothetical protein
MKSQRITSTEKILQTRKLKLPGPGTYKPKHNFKVYNPPKITTPQLVMLEEAKFRGKQTPGPIYNIAPIKDPKAKPFVGLHPYSRGCQIYPKQREKGQQCKGSRGGSHAHIVPKKKDPAPGTYEDNKSIEKTQRTNIQWAFSKSKRTSFFEQIAEKSKKIPGVGQYVNMEKSMDNCLSSPPTSLKRLR